MGQLPAKLNADQCIKQFMRETRARAFLTGD